MASIESKQLIVEIMQRGGTYTGDVMYQSVWKYTTKGNTEAYAIFDTHEHDMHRSPAVFEPVLLMVRGILTEEGRKFLNDNSN